MNYYGIMYSVLIDAIVAWGGTYKIALSKLVNIQKTVFKSFGKIEIHMFPLYEVE